MAGGCRGRDGCLARPTAHALAPLAGRRKFGSNVRFTPPSTKLSTKTLYLRVRVRFVHAADQPTVTFADYLVRLIDRELLVDDELAIKSLNADGSVELDFHVSEMNSADSPLESEPDLYLLLLRRRETMRKTAVIPDVHFLSVNPHSGIRNRLTRDLGTITI